MGMFPDLSTDQLINHFVTAVEAEQVLICWGFNFYIQGAGSYPVGDYAEFHCMTKLCFSIHCRSINGSCCGDFAGTAKHRSRADCTCIMVL